MGDGDAILIAAQSGRALAQAARRAGLRPFVLDLFGDEDTIAFAKAHDRVEGQFGTGRLGGRSVLSALDRLAERAGGRPLGLILGSGFEGAPDLVEALAARHTLFGASADAVRALKDPRRFAALCARLAIPHPPITTGRVPDRHNWLCKRAGGSGGSHIRVATGGPAPPGCYFQARMPGQARALNFLADDGGVQVLAVTEQWSFPSPLRPYRYAGAIAPGRNEASSVAPDLLSDIEASVGRLVAETGLRGLASADLLIDRSAWWLLEINPRPGATLDVLDRRTTPLLLAHIEACLGRTPSMGPAPLDAAGAEICYAPRGYAVMPAVDWPDCVRDRPRPGTRVARDAPLCTVTASGADAAAVRNVLREGARAVVARLHMKEDNDGYRFEAAEHQRAERTADRPVGE